MIQLVQCPPSHKLHSLNFAPNWIFHSGGDIWLATTPGAWQFLVLWIDKHSPQSVYVVSRVNYVPKPPKSTGS